MNQLVEIIETALDERQEETTNKELAKLLAEKLLTVALQQLTSVVGGNLDYEDDGRAVIRTRFYNTGKTLAERVKDSWNHA